MPVLRSCAADSVLQRGRDREALGKALIDGKPEPASEAARIEAEIEQEERRAEALRLAVETAHRQVAELVAVNRAAWRRRAMQELARTKHDYLQAIEELPALRQALSDEAMFVAWLDGGSGAEAATDSLGGRVGADADGRPAVSFTATLVELRADADALAAHPTTRNDPHPRPRFELARGGVQGMRVSGWGGE